MIHNFENNLDASKKADLRTILDNFYKKVFVGVIKIEQPIYETSEGKKKEKLGTDSTVYTESFNHIIQEKLRFPKYWDYRGKDLYVELKNEARGGNGWFKEYKGNIDFLLYYFKKDEQLSEIYFILYNKYFFELVQNCIDTDKVEYKNPHLQEFRNGKIGGETSGIIVKQKDIKPCEVFRYYFSNNNFERL